jgi:SWI/SNF-related matrix-associated actin-dependent regulator 1 of chromatin subfamily A
MSTTNALFRKLQYQPQDEIPGIWPDKYGRGCRCPINALPLIGADQPYLDGVGELKATLGSRHLLPWVGGFLMPHQVSILEKALTRPGFNVWSPPGSGKTLIGIAWLSHPGSGTRLVITKAAARGTWREEIRKYSYFEPVVLEGRAPTNSLQERIDGLVAEQKTPVFIVAWETLIGWKDALVNLKIDSLVMDEIHWAKNHKRVTPTITRTGKTRFDPLPNTAAAVKKLADVARRRLGLTATPIPNRPKDLWAQLDLVEPWQWGTYHKFGVRYCAGMKNAYGWEYPGLSNEDELMERLKWSKHKISQHAISVNLPDKRRQVVRLPLAEQNRPAGFKRDIVRASKTGNKDNLFEVMLFEAASRKRKYVVERVTEAVKCGQKVVVFTGRRKDCEVLGEALSKLDCPVWCAHGGTSTEKRDLIRHEYMEADVGILVGTGDAWGESVNLQDTDLALFVMLPWTPRAIRQWEGRFCRLGQKRPVLISYIIASGTVDEHVADILLDKLPAVGAVAEDEAISEVEAAFGSSGEDLLDRIKNIFSDQT